MKTLIKNGTIITAYEEFEGDILIEEEKIVDIGKDLAASCVKVDKIIDASGKLVFPGGVDQHTHYDAQGTVGDKNTAGYETTDNAIVGGTTTFVEFVPQEEGMGLIDSAEYRKKHRAEGKICVDYALHALATDVKPAIFDEVEKLPEYGISTIKVFMAYPGSYLHADDGTLMRILEKSKNVGVTTFVHAENGEIIEFLRDECVRSGNTAPKYHYLSRPPVSESEAARRAIYLAKAAAAPLFIVHMTCEEALEELRIAKSGRLNVYGETCTHYLVTTKAALDNPDFMEAAKYICSPALRDEKDCEALWEALDSGLLSAVSSDHCGISLKEMKLAGKDDFTKVPNGAPGAGDRLNMVWTNGVAKGRISKTKFVEICATNPAKINGIYPRKGHIGIGSDADLVIFDPQYKGVVRQRDNPNGIDYNIFEGREQIGRPETVLLRGKVVVENARFTGKKGQGTFIKAKPYGACYRGL